MGTHRWNCQNPSPHGAYILLAEIYSIVSGHGTGYETKQNQKRPEGTEIESDKKRVSVGLFETVLRGGHWAETWIKWYQTRQGPEGGEFQAEGEASAKLWGRNDLEVFRE